MPTLHEIFGFVFLEAFAYGAVPIALDTFGVNNIITHDTNGYVVEYENKFHRDNYQFIDHYNDNIQQLISGMSESQETKIIADIVTHLSRLIENPSVLKNMREQ
jgi:glycosyltransferase involved in cell wall biosynthesis